MVLWLSLDGDVATGDDDLSADDAVTAVRSHDEVDVDDVQDLVEVGGACEALAASVASVESHDLRLLLLN